MGLIIVVALGDQEGGRADHGLGLLILIVALSFSILIHELGHLFAGHALGFRFRSISVGLFSLRLEHGKLKIRLRKEMTTLGYADMYVDNVRRLRRRMLIYAVAGSGANLLSVLVVIPFAYRLPFTLSELVSSSFANQFVTHSCWRGVYCRSVREAPMTARALQCCSLIANELGDALASGRSEYCDGREFDRRIGRRLG